MRRLEAERLEARQQIEALDSEPKQRIQFWGYWPWLLTVPVFFIIDNLWSRTAAWWLAILALPFLAFPTFVKVNEKILDENTKRDRRRKDLEIEERLAQSRIDREEQSLKPRNRSYGYSRRRSYRRGYRRW